MFENKDDLRERIKTLTGRTPPSRPNIIEDTSSYMAIHAGCVLRLAGNDYFVMGDTKEGRFGIEDQPKFWVKRAVDLTTGENKIIKLVFYEQFSTTIAGITVRCKRNPGKESAFLELVQGNPRFMQGITVTDPAGNLIRIIDFIRGNSFFNQVASMKVAHEEYFHEVLPGMMKNVVECIEAMAEVHRNGHHHGDIRNDHILIESESKEYIWIDFDYEVNFLDHDIWSMGNVLNYAVGKGIHSFYEATRKPEKYPLRTQGLDERDALAFYHYRIGNLRKLYPYISAELNDLLMRFSNETLDPYEDLESMARDLRSLFNLESGEAKK